MSISNKSEIIWWYLEICRQQKAGPRQRTDRLPTMHKWLQPVINAAKERSDATGSYQSARVAGSPDMVAASRIDGGGSISQSSCKLQNRYFRDMLLPALIPLILEQ